MLKNKTIYWASVCLYIALTFLSFYCACYRLPVAVKYGINLLVFGWACIDFMIRPQWERGMFCLRFFTLFFFPYLLFWTWSVGEKACFFATGQRLDEAEFVLYEPDDALCQRRRVVRQNAAALIAGGIANRRIDCPNQREDKKRKQNE